MVDARWRLDLLGRTELTGPDGAAAARILVHPKHLVMVAYLALEARDAAPCFRRRDELAGLLWPELDQGHARASLRRVVHEVRAALGAGVFLSRGDEELSLNVDALTSDVGAFTHAIANDQLLAALELWKGELMPGFHVTECAELDRRIDAHRAALQEDAGLAAWALAQRFEANAELSLAGRWARRAPRFAPDDERVLRRALTMLDRLGDRAGALRAYDDFARRLREEFETEPSPQTTALIVRIRGDSP